MFARSRSLVLCLVLLAAVTLATAVHAGPKMYMGSITFHAFGNTSVLDPSTAPMSMGEPLETYLYSTFGNVPVGVFCNYNHYTMYVLPGNKVYTGPLKISTAYPRPSARQEFIMPCESKPTLTMGVPVTGSGTLSTFTMLTTMGTTYNFMGSTAAIVLPGNGNIYDTLSGSFDYTYPYIYEITYATFGTGPGTLFAGGGPGSTTVSRGQGQFSGYAGLRAGDNQFGGTARLLGQNGSTGFYKGANFGIFWNFSQGYWLFQLVGASYRGYDCTRSGGMAIHTQCTSVTTEMNTYTDGYRNKAYTMMGSPVYSTSYVYVTAFPWTTGVAFVEAIRGPVPSVIQRTGYDNRSVNGGGVIQLVTPHLINWIGQAFANPTAAVAIMRLEFAPEAKSWLMLGAGIGLLGLLYRCRSRG